MKITVIIPTRLRAAHLRKTLECLDGQTETDFEVVVVCDGPDPQTRDLAGSLHFSYPLEWIFLEENRGQASAINSAVERSSGEILLFLDDDITFTPDLLAQHLAPFRSGQADVVLGRIYDSYDRPPRCATEAYLRETQEEYLGKIDEILRTRGPKLRESVWVGLNTSIRTTLFQRSGGNDPQLRRVASVDLGLRVLDAGARFLYEPQAAVAHHNPKDLVAFVEEASFQFGFSDAHRFRNKKQREAALEHLIPAFFGTRTQRWKHRLARALPGVFLAIAPLFHGLSDATRSRFFFRVWRYLAFYPRYWKGVRAICPDLMDLRRLLAEEVRER